jgi:hypothetical protein
MGVGGLHVLFDAATAVWVARMKEGARESARPNEKQCLDQNFPPKLLTKE